MKLLNQTGQAESINLNGGRPVDIVLTGEGEVSRKVTTKRGPGVNPIVDLAPPRFRSMQFAIQRRGQTSIGVLDKPSGFPVGAIRQLETGEVKGDPVSCLVESAQQVCRRFVARSHMDIVEQSSCRWKRRENSVRQIVTLPTRQLQPGSTAQPSLKSRWGRIFR